MSDESAAAIRETRKDWISVLRPKRRLVSWKFCKRRWRGF